jgi:hypothetical protein
VILLRVSNESNAYKMFETLNDRGLKTTQSDLVKNYLFGRAEDRLTEIKEKWAYMRGTLDSFADGPDITVRFLRHALIVIQGHIKESAVYDAVQNVAKSSNSSMGFARELEVLSNSYAAIHSRNHEKWNTYSETTRKAIDVLDLFDIKPVRPLMLAVAHKFSEKETLKTFQFLISSCVRLLISNVSTTSGSVEIPFSTVANKVFLKEIASADEIKRELRDVVPNDAQFQLRFEIATVSNEKLARYYLRSLEMAAKGTSEPWFIVNDDGQTINLEHILPKNPQENWPLFSSEDIKVHVKRIGNLALLQATSNSTLKSEGFSVKKSIFANSPYTLTAKIAAYDDWNPGAIAQRQKDLALLAIKTWPL